MVADGMWNGGAERQLALLASSLPAPWSASVVSMQDGPYRPVLEGLGIGVDVVPRRFRFDITPAFRMWRAAARISPDIVHSWGWMSTLAMVPFCRARGIPLVAGTIRRGDLPPRRAWGYRLGMALSDTVVANSRAGLEAFGIPEGARGHVVYNGFDCARLAGAVRAGDAATTNGFVAVMAARMADGKDWAVLLDAARRLAAEAAGWTVIALGDGPDRAGLVHQAADLIASGTMQFPDPGLEVVPALMTADVGVLLSDPRSHAEGCSNAIMEYMACGLPVVCTDSGGNPELVEDGVTGFLVPPRDADALVSALRSLRKDPGRAADMGREGRLRLEPRFSVATMVDAYVRIYGSVMDRHGRTHL